MEFRIEALRKRACCALFCLGLGWSAQVIGACLPVPGDVDGDGETTVADVQCELLTLLWGLAGATGPAPACLRPDASPLIVADMDCSGVVTVGDAVVLINIAIGSPLSPALDPDGDNCADACQSDHDGDGEADVLDCAPNDALISSAAPELCNGYDDNCNGLVDEAVDPNVALSCSNEDLCDGVEVCMPTAIASKVYLNEVLVVPANGEGATGQWVEVGNGTGEAVNLAGWTLTWVDASAPVLVEHVIDAGGPVFLPANGHLVLAASIDPNVNGGFYAHYAVPELNLSAANPTVTLRNPEGAVVDAFFWPDPVPTGASIARIQPDGTVTLPSSWSISFAVLFEGATAGTPGAPNVDLAPASCGEGPPSSICPDADGTWIEISPLFRQASAVRLDDSHVAIAYTETDDPDSPVNSYRVRVLRREGDEFILGPAKIINDKDVAATSTSTGLDLMGAFGSTHFVVARRNAAGQYWVDLLARSEFNTFTTAGWSPPGIHELMGHPVDDTRYIFRRRVVEAPHDVRYNLLLRNGNSLSLGPNLKRPAPSEFAGTPPAEPGGFSPLIRTGPYTFRELRGGYPATPGVLTAWTLSLVEPDLPFLEWSEPVVLSNSAPASRNALVAADPAGAALAIYESVGNGLWGATTPGGFAGIDPLGPVSTGTTNQPGQGNDSTDGYYLGAYHIRTQSGDVLRVQSLGAPSVETLATGLPWAECPSAPHMMRMDDQGLFVVCEPGQPLRIRAIEL